MKELLENFNNPSSEFRTAPFWIWNDEMDKAEIERQLREMHSHGFGGAFAHARLGLMTPYLGEEWFDCFTHALRVCKELGMKLYIYDENNWPSGAAGGIVTENKPDCRNRWVEKAVVSTNSINYKGNLVKAYAYDEENDKILSELTDKPQDEWKNVSGKALVFSHVEANHSGWYGGFMEPNNYDRECVAEFLKVTHEEYYKRYHEDFGDTIPAIFTDEPFQVAYPWGRDLNKTFFDMHGYKIEDNLPALFGNPEGFSYDRTPEKVRYDYVETRHTLWTENYIKQIADWCGEHNIKFTGHLVEHFWPRTDSPSTMSCYEYMQWPGTDGLCCHHLEDVSYSGTSFMAEELRSVSNQLGKERILNEMYGCGMWDVTFNQFKRIGDWWMVNGTNFMCQHLMHSTISGIRKRDCIQSIDWRQPWWDEYTKLNDYFARASYLLSQGKMEQRILILNPATSSYVIPYVDQHDHINSAIETDYIKYPDMNDFLEILRMLTNEQWDYDLGDEYIIEHQAKVNGNKFSIGLQNYDVVIVSKNMTNFRTPTAKLLLEYIKNGGTVLATGDAGEFIDGERTSPLTNELRSAWKTVASRDELLLKIDSMLERRLVPADGWVQGFEHMRRDYGDGRVGYFIINHTLEHQDLKLTLPGTSVSKWDLFTGNVEKLVYSVENDKVTFDLPLDWEQSAFVMTGDNTPSAEKIRYVSARKIPASLVSAERDGFNYMPCLFCDIEFGDKKLENVPYYVAQKKLFRAHGFGEDPWQCSLQHKRDYLDRTFPDDKGFKVTYRFMVKPGTRPSVLNVIIERPELYSTITLNGKKLDLASANVSFLDRHMFAFPIADKIIDGENILVLDSDTFELRNEVEDIYLEGTFGITEYSSKYAIGEESRISYGNWAREAGLEFYPGAVRYKFNAKIEYMPDLAILDLKNTTASAVSLKVNGIDCGLVGADGDKVSEISSCLHMGDNDIEVRVSGSFCNLFGPIRYTGPEGDKDMFEFKTLPEEGGIAYGSVEPHPYGIMSEPKILMKYRKK